MTLAGYLRAARPVAYPAIGLPLLLGQALAFGCAQQHRRVSQPLGALATVLATHVHGAISMVAVLFLNDYADEATDRLNKTFYISGGSRAIQMGLVTGEMLYDRAIRLIALDCAFLALIGFAFERPLLPILGMIGLSCGWVYSMPPFSLSHRGYGEALQAWTLAYALPVFSYYFASNDLEGFPWSTLGLTLPIFYASNVNSALPDYPSDCATKRLTRPVRVGQRRARTEVVALTALGCALTWLSIPICATPFLTVLSCVGVFYVAIASRLVPDSDISTNRERCKSFVRLNVAVHTVIIFIFALGHHKGVEFQEANFI
jgi:1,4-dihydroxy-2-naphthoate octaprenyltransferase